MHPFPAVFPRAKSPAAKALRGEDASHGACLLSSGLYRWHRRQTPPLGRRMAVLPGSHRSQPRHNAPGRGLVGRSRITASGEFHPAPKTALFKFWNPFPGRRGSFFILPRIARGVKGDFLSEPAGDGPRFGRERRTAVGSGFRGPGADPVPPSRGDGRGCLARAFLPFRYRCRRGMRPAPEGGRAGREALHRGMAGRAAVSLSPLLRFEACPSGPRGENARIPSGSLRFLPPKAIVFGKGLRYNGGCGENPG